MPPKYGERSKDSQIYIYSPVNLWTVINSFVSWASEISERLIDFYSLSAWKCHFMRKYVSVSTNTTLALQEVQLFVANAVPIILVFVLRHTVSGVCKAGSLISPQALRWIQPLPAINDGVCKACQSLLLVSPYFVSSHASSLPMWCRPMWLEGNVNSRILTEMTTYRLRWANLAVFAHAAKRWHWWKRAEHHISS